MKKFTGAILATLLLLPSIGCGWGPWDFPGPWHRHGYYGPGYEYPGGRRHPDYDDDDRHSESDADAAVLGAVLGTAAVIGTVLVVDAIRNQPAPQPPASSSNP